ncbi:hypothetical protein BDFB_006019 [Asbolus verrucosus]|uniref:Uncharacterized protein n=1 Tax=Asbolus verrucosus TaxID=1661398 RepID=A0A482VF08_ASBVE|nr:hypothetical protein BDFB_006019 [Asbolus verrucosus]
MENGLILCKFALKSFGNVFLLTLLVFLLKTFEILTRKRVQVDPKREHQKSLRKCRVLWRELFQSRFGSYQRKLSYSIEPATQS